MGIVQRLRKRTYSWIDDFSMISNWDKVLVCVSGWKDSLAMLDILSNIQKSSNLRFSIIAVYVIPEVPWIINLWDKLKKIFNSYWVEYIIQKMNIPKESKLKDWIEQATSCQWCTYTRRITLYKLAEQIKADKIAYWHHMDDIIDTLFLNISVWRRMDIMLPVNKMRKWDFSVIRPMTYLREKDIIKYCDKLWLAPLDSSCPLDKISNREKIRKVVDDIEKNIPNFVEKMFFAYKSKCWMKDNYLLEPWNDSYKTVSNNN